MPATDQTLTEALAEIGVSHRKSARYHSHRDLIAADGETIDAVDVGWGWDFVHAAQAAA